MPYERSFTGPDRTVVITRSNPNPVIYEPHVINKKPIAAGAVMEKTGINSTITIHFAGELPHLVNPEQYGLRVSMSYEGKQPASLSPVDQPEHVVKIQGHPELTERFMRTLAVVNNETITVKATGASIREINPQLNNDSQAVLRVYSPLTHIKPHAVSKDDKPLVDVSVNNRFKSGITGEMEAEITYIGLKSDVLRIAQQSFDIPQDRLMELSPFEIIQGSKATEEVAA